MSGLTAAHAEPVDESALGIPLDASGGTTVTVTPKAPAPEEGGEETPAGPVFVDIAIGTGWIGGLTADGKVYTWGQDGPGTSKFGSLAQNSVDQIVPKPTEIVRGAIPDGVKIVDIAASGQVGFALGDNQRAYSWGTDNATGKNYLTALNYFTTSTKSYPVPNQLKENANLDKYGMPPFSDISASDGSSAYAVTADGMLRGWGASDGGALPGQSGGRTYAVSLTMPAGVTVKKLATHSGQGTAFIGSDGQLYTFGTWTGNTVPTAVPRGGDAADAVLDEVAATAGGALVRAESGDVLFYGGTSGGTLSLGQDAAGKLVKLPMPGGFTATDIAINQERAFVLGAAADGSKQILAWGAGDTEAKPLALPAGFVPKSLDAAGQLMVALSEAGQPAYLGTAGGNTAGWMGDGNTETLPVQTTLSVGNAAAPAKPAISNVKLVTDTGTELTTLASNGDGTYSGIAPKAAAGTKAKVTFDWGTPDKSDMIEIDQAYTYDNAPRITAPGGLVDDQNQPITVQQGAEFPRTQVETASSVFPVTFGLEGDPQGLTIDAQTGVLSGTIPMDAATGPVNFKVTAENALGTTSYSYQYVVKETITTSQITYDMGEAPGALPAGAPMTFKSNDPALTIPWPRVTGWTFLGWIVNGEGDAVKDVVIPTGTRQDINLKATWARVTNTVVFKQMVEGQLTEVRTQEVPYNEAIDATLPTMEGFTFGPWTVDGKDYAVDTPVRKGLTLVSEGTRNIYTVTLRQCEPKQGQTGEEPQSDGAQSGDQSQSSGTGQVCTDTVQKVAYMDTATEPRPQSKDGKKIDYWTLDPNVPEPERYIFNTDVTHDIVLYPVWTDISYEVTFLYGDRTETVDVGWKSKVTEPEPVRKDGKIIVGWRPLASSTNWDFDAIVDRNMMLQPQWGDFRPTVVFQDSTGTEFATADTAWNTPVEVPEAPAQEGYAFSKWVAMPDATDVDPAAPVTDDAVWKAVYVKEHTVTFDVGEGAPAPEAITVKDGQPITAEDAPENPARTGYDFGGWFTEGGAEVTFPYTPATDTALYAKWDAKVQKVSFDGRNGVDPVVTEQKFDSQVADPGDPVFTGRTFQGWFTDPSFPADAKRVEFPVTVDGDMAFYAKWSVDTHAITFVSNGGSDVAKVEGEYGSAVTRPADPEREGYTFVDWFADKDLEQKYTFPETLTADATVYAKWDAKVQKVSFDGRNGVDPVVTEQKFDSQVADPGDPVFTGRTFQGWFTDPSFPADAKRVEFPVTVDGDMAFYAKWSVDTHAITFVSNGGSDVAKVEGEYGSAVTRPADPEREGYTFVDWFADKDLEQKYTFPETLTADATVYAKWEINTYTVTFDANGGKALTGDSATRTAVFGTALTDAAPTATRDGHSFARWTTDKEGATAFDPATTPVTKDITVYAQWDINTYTVTFDSLDGTKVPDASVVYGKTVDRPSDPKLAEKDFVNWYVSDTATEPYDFGTPITGDLTLIARYAPIPDVTVIFHADGQDDYTKTVRRDKSMVLKNPVAKPHFDFAGWFDRPEGGTRYTSETPIPATMDLYAQYTAIPTFLVTFDARGGKGGVTTQEVERDQLAVVPPAPVMDDMDFAGWFTDEKLTTPFAVESTPITESLVLYAKYTEIPDVTVTFEANGGDAVEPQTVRRDRTITKPADPFKQDADFAGWFTDETLTKPFDFAAGVPESMTLYARWSNPEDAKVIGNTMVIRHGGKTRYDTASIANAKHPQTGGIAFITTGENYPDALSIAPAVVQQKGTLYLSHPETGLSDSDLKLIKAQKPSTIILLGGRKIVPNMVMDQIGGTATFDRIEGKTRYETSQQIANRYFKGAKRAYIATGENFADALSVGSLAAYQNAPILLVKGNEQQALTAGQRQLLDGRAQVTILGGKVAISPALETAARASGLSVERWEGKSRFETSARIAQEYRTDATELWLATGNHFADALVAGPLAGRTGSPVLLVSRDEFPAASLKVLERFPEVRTRYVMGGAKVAVSDPVAIGGLSADTGIDDSGAEETPVEPTA